MHSKLAQSYKGMFLPDCQLLMVSSDAREPMVSAIAISEKVTWGAGAVFVLSLLSLLVFRGGQSAHDLNDLSDMRRRLNRV